METRPVVFAGQAESSTLLCFCMERLGGAETAICMAIRDEFVGMGLVELVTFGLSIWSIRPSDFRA